jgi:hypothetical protein
VWKDQAMLKLATALPALALVLLLGASEVEAQPTKTRPTHASAGVDFLYGHINNPLPAFFGGGNDISLIGLNLRGHYQLGRGLLLGGHLPLAHAQFDDDSGTSLGNLTAELNYRLSLHARSESWLDASLSLGTASDSGDGALAAQTFAVFWMADPGFYLPDTNTLRLMYRHAFGDQRMQLNLEAGVQYLFISDVDDQARLPFRVGGQIDLGPRLELLGRFSTYWLVDADDGEDDFLHMLELGINLLQVGRGEVEALVYYPLDEVYRDNFEVWGLQIGFTTRL